jgi:acetyl esterase/lipase
MEAARKIASALVLLAVPALFAHHGHSRIRQMTVKDLLAQPASRPDFTIPYNRGPQQFGQLRLPEGEAPYPVVVVVHGGCWLAEYDLQHISPLAARITELGFATWSLEYRRIGDPGGGWPGTFLDIGDGIDVLKNLAGRHKLDLTRIVALGHSAGGHLALWAAARHKLPADSTLYRDDPLPILGVVSLAGVGDLTRLEHQPGCGGSALKLMGGSPRQFPDRYRQGSPRELLPLGVPQILIQGARDPIISPAGAREYHDFAQNQGDSCILIMLPEAGHYEAVIPTSPAWPSVKDALRRLLH